VPISDIKIVDTETRKPVPAFQSGLVLVRGPQVMKEYYNDPEATAEAIDNEGWFNTGDVGYVDSDDFLYLQDRRECPFVRVQLNAS
jgi:long-chain acyl-CoA synthetase